MNSAEPSSPSAGNSGQDRRRMAELLERLATREGATPTPLPGVRIFRDTRVRPRSPVVYSPRIVIVAQGRKRGYLGEVAYTYDPDNYLVLSVPLPFECEIAQASAAEPFLALAVDVDVAVLGELVLELGETAPAPPVRVGVSSCPLTPELRQAAVRLLECLLSPDDSRILGPQVVREIVYRVLRGEQGPALRALTGPHNGFAQIARALRRIHTEYPEPLDVEIGRASCRERV